MLCAGLGRGGLVNNIGRKEGRGVALSHGLARALDS